MESETVELYKSENGDRWLLARDAASGRVFIRHIPNVPSGGKVSEIEIGSFLCGRSYGPQHMHLLRLIGTLVKERAVPGHHETPADLIAKRTETSSKFLCTDTTHHSLIAS